MAKKRVHVYISGRVQGVYFRQNTLKAAGKLGVLGWVRNTSDGRVEALFEGDEDAVNSIIEWCRKGPSFARVDHVEMLEEKYRGEFSDFRVKH